MRSKILIAITGGMGSGKSLASQYLRRLGYFVISADRITHELYEKNKALKNKLIQNFGQEIFTESGKLSHNKAREIFFSSKKMIEKVNRIVHPYVIKAIDDIIKSYSGNIVFVESAIVFESMYYRKFDYILLICARKNIRLKRVVRSRHISEKVALKLMSYQMTDKKKLQLSDFVIYNNSDKKELFRSIKYFSAIIDKIFG